MTASSRQFEPDNQKNKKPLNQGLMFGAGTTNRTRDLL